MLTGHPEPAPASRVRPRGGGAVIWRHGQQPFVATPFGLEEPSTATATDGAAFLYCVTSPLRLSARPQTDGLWVPLLNAGRDGRGYEDALCADEVSPHPDFGNRSLVGSGSLTHYPPVAELALALGLAIARLFTALRAATFTCPMPGRTDDHKPT